MKHKGLKKGETAMKEMMKAWVQKEFDGDTGIKEREGGDTHG